MAIAVATSKITESAAATSHTVAMPASVASGDGLLMIAGTKNGTGTNTVGAPNGDASWTALFAGAVGSFFTYCRISYKISDGSEGASETVATGESDELAAIVYRITGHHTTTAPERAAAWVTGTSTAPDPPSLDPSGWGTEEALWFEIVLLKDPRTFTPSTNYTENTEGEADSNGEIVVCAATRVLSASSEDPGAAAISGAGDPWGAMTVVWRPAAAAAGSKGAGVGRALGGLVNTGLVQRSMTKLGRLWVPDHRIIRPRLVPVGIAL